MDERWSEIRAQAVVRSEADCASAARQIEAPFNTLPNKLYHEPTCFKVWATCFHVVRCFVTRSFRARLAGHAPFRAAERWVVKLFTKTVGRIGLVWWYSVTMKGH